MRATIAFAVVVAALSSSAEAWWCNGHMITSEIARQNLHPGVEDKVNQYVTFMHDKGPYTQSPDMVQAACWADDLKAQGIEEMHGWHFINLPYDPSKFPLPATARLQDDNVAQNVNKLSHGMETSRAGRSNRWDMAFALMNLLHFVGDVHQPLHAATLYSSRFPNSDRGGNEWHVTYQGQRTNLHDIWDSVCETYPDEKRRPLTQDNVQWIRDQAAMIQRDTTVSPAMRAVTNGTVMAEEGLKWAESTAYANGIQVDGDVSSSYITACTPVARLRLAQGGYRLASILNAIFADEHHEKRLSMLPRHLNRWHADFVNAILSKKMN